MQVEVRQQTKQLQNSRGKVKEVEICPEALQRTRWLGSQEGDEVAFQATQPFCIPSYLSLFFNQVQLKLFLPFSVSLTLLMKWIYSLSIDYFRFMQ